MSRIARRLFRNLTLARPIANLLDQWNPLPTLGQRGEREAERYLLRQGMVIIARGYQDKSGEIDLIAVDDDTIVFVEVKTRSSNIAGEPEEAVDETKQRHLTITGTGYLKWHRLTDCRVRFDVIAIVWPTDSKSPKIAHYENAFEPAGNLQMF